MTRPAAIQMFPFAPALEAALAQRFDLARWFELSPAAQDDWLAANAGRTSAVATAGHIGCDNALIDRLPALKIIAIHGVGFDRIDIPGAKARDIAVTITPGALDDDVADLAVGLVIALLRQIPSADSFVRVGRWSHENFPLATKVTGKRFGIVGLGQIGSASARRLAAFGPVAYTSRAAKPVDYAHYPDAKALAEAVDVLVVACAANDQTRGMIDAEVLAALGPQGYLVNIARGAIVDEPALIAALADGTIAGAGLDVFADEPHVPQALIDSKRTVLTPHVASGTHETRKRMAEIVLENLDAMLAGEKPPHSLT